ncbi:TSUP family transporter [Paenibacillus lemnae]|uniref:Probable membrane transporter protein n=1 Tax=Paenibacillus lemnae TaxID=1330551 RepID=A0A848M811_PAELE|nr:sulfite exporter TauE/SafE family protein [Paenibacillus lemnae]
MDVGIYEVIILFLIGFAGSFLSGMMGVGGAIILYPLVLYVPPLLGAAAFTPHEVSGITAVQVLFATLGGIWAYRKSGYLNKRLIVVMGAAILTGSLIGGFGSRFLDGEGINMMYGGLAVMAAIMMLIPVKGNSGLAEDVKEVKFNAGLAALLALLVGAASGIVGAGGSFLLIPILLVVLKLPFRIVIASSMAITFISSLGVTGGKLAAGQVVLLPALVMVAAALIASPLGVKVGQRMRTSVLKWMLAVMIFAVAVKMGLELL